MGDRRNGQFDGYEHRAPRRPRATWRPIRIATSDCACGGSIVSRSRLTEDVMQAIRFHQESDRHRVWRVRWGGM